MPAINKKYIIGLAAFLAVFWFLYDFVLVKSTEFQIKGGYTFENRTVREVADSMSNETQRLLGGVDEKEQITGFVHIIERNRYLLLKNAISPESYYDFINTILYPFQKISTKKKSLYAYQVRKYLRRMRKTQYDYVKYEMSEPEFYYKDYTRNAEVSVVRVTLEGKKEYRKHHFRQYKERYYLYLL
jgi:hypothetical protein